MPQERAPLRVLVRAADGARYALRAPLDATLWWEEGGEERSLRVGTGGRRVLRLLE